MTQSCGDVEHCGTLVPWLRVAANGNQVRKQERYNPYKYSTCQAQANTAMDPMD